ncbi:hypothetical protein CCACVL1_16572 [Corchorus capsularis]|uniref:Uncharacterized protein n=1 Tax=Corchorus capsularis TaxID=210143 RepID=A0A1R3HWG8_COCAP|nr:hypothetical protein CCACVL1_16572 [Corchorus capsularis]
MADPTERCLEQHRTEWVSWLPPIPASLKCSPRIPFRNGQKIPISN